MNRIEEIKRICKIYVEHIDNLKAEGLEKYVHSMQKEYAQDVSFLLSRLQIAEEALKEIKRQDVRDTMKDSYLAPIYREIAIQALEQIHKEE